MQGAFQHILLALPETKAYGMLHQLYHRSSVGGLYAVGADLASSCLTSFRCESTLLNEHCAVSPPLQSRQQSLYSMSVVRGQNRSSHSV